MTKTVVPVNAQDILGPILVEYSGIIREEESFIEKLTLEIDYTKNVIQILLNEQKEISDNVDTDIEIAEDFKPIIEKQKLRKFLNKQSTQHEIVLDQLEGDIKVGQTTIQEYVGKIKKYQEDVSNKEQEIRVHNKKLEIIKSTMSDINMAISVLNGLQVPGGEQGEDREIQAIAYLNKINANIQVLSKQISNYPKELSTEQKIHKAIDMKTYSWYIRCVGNLFGKLFTSPAWVSKRIVQDKEFIVLSGSGTWEDSVLTSQKEGLQVILKETIQNCFENYEEYQQLCNLLIENDVLGPISSLKYNPSDSDVSLDNYAYRWNQVTKIIDFYPQLNNIIESMYLDKIVDDLIQEIEWYQDNYRDVHTLLLCMKKLLPKNIYEKIFDKVMSKDIKYRAINNHALLEGDNEIMFHHLVGYPSQPTLLTKRRNDKWEKKARIVDITEYIHLFHWEMIHAKYNNNDDVLKEGDLIIEKLYQYIVYPSESDNGYWISDCQKLTGATVICQIRDNARLLKIQKDSTDSGT